MSNGNKNTPQKDSEKIQWFGIDGLLIVLYFIEAIVIGWALINNVDAIVGYAVPYTVAIVTTVIFLKYLSEVFLFSKGSKKNKK